MPIGRTTGLWIDETLGGVIGQTVEEQTSDTSRLLDQIARISPFINLQVQPASTEQGATLPKIINDTIRKIGRLPII